MIDSPYLVTPGKKLKLSKRDTNDKGHFRDRDDAERECAKNLEKLAQLQEVLYAESKRSLLVVFQAMDAGGKDGAIRHIFSGVNPQGYNRNQDNTCNPGRVRKLTPQPRLLRNSARVRLPCTTG